jgi:clan AA aspartic protease
MMTGRVSWQLEAIVNVEIQDAEGYFHTLQCTLDTGFDGDIALPSGAIERLGLVTADIIRVTLANGTRVSMPRYSAKVSWHGQLVEVEVLQTEGESAIGMSLLENSIVKLQVWDGGEVLIEERP